MGLVRQFKKGDVIQIGILKITVNSNRASLNIELPKEVKIEIIKAIQNVPEVKTDS